MSKSGGLRGMAALASKMLSTKSRGGGGKRAPRGALNAAHRILAQMGAPVAGDCLTAMALGLGYWVSDGENPDNNFIHVLNDNSKAENGIIRKTGPSMYTLRDGVGDPLPVTGPDIATPEDASALAVMIHAGRVPSLPGVDVPPVSITPTRIAEHLAGVKIDDLDTSTADGQAEAQQITDNALVIAEILTKAGVSYPKEK